MEQSVIALRLTETWLTAVLFNAIRSQLEEQKPNKNLIKMILTVLSNVIIGRPVLFWI